MSLPLIYAFALTAALLLALAVGSVEARLITVGIVAAQVTGMVAFPGTWDHALLGVFVVDLALLGWFGWIIVKTSLLWPLALGVLQTLTVLGHIARLAAPDMDRMGYFVLLQWTAWPAFLAILIGTVLDWRAGRTSRAFWQTRA